MEFNVFYSCLAITGLCFFGFFYIWLSMLHDCLRSLSEKIDMKMNNHVNVITETRMVEALSHLSRKMDQIKCSQYSTVPVKKTPIKKKNEKGIK